MDEGSCAHCQHNCESRCSMCYACACDEDDIVIDIRDYNNIRYNVCGDCRIKWFDLQIIRDPETDKSGYFTFCVGDDEFKEYSLLWHHVREREQNEDLTYSFYYSNNKKRKRIDEQPFSSPEAFIKHVRQYDLDNNVENTYWTPVKEWRFKELELIETEMKWLKRKKYLLLKR